MIQGISRLAVQERAHRKPVERPVRFPVQHRKEPDGIPGCKFCGLVPARYKICPEHFQRRLDATADISTSTDNIRMILESDFARKAHPIQEYFNALPLLNPAEHGHIGRLLNTVQVANPGKWEEYFTKWLVGVIANAMNDTGCQNHTCLVLTGDKQGQFKSWWLDNLCPTPLKNYLFTGKIDPQGKDILTLIAEYLFINIDDQLKELNKQNENALKNLITTPGGEIPQTV